MTWLLYQGLALRGLIILIIIIIIIMTFGQSKFAKNPKISDNRRLFSLS